MVIISVTKTGEKVATSKKPKKTKAQVEKDLLEIESFKWQFLQRNEGYIEDCKRWRGISDERHFNKREIILSYPYKGKLDGSGTPTLQTELSKYYDVHTKEWALLSSTKDERRVYEKILSERKGEIPRFRLAHYKRDYTWHEYAEKWDINLPLNPDVDYLPFFVHVAPHKIISTTPHLDYKRPRNNIFVVRKRRHTSVIRVNWEVPSVHILHEFNKLLSFMKSRRKEYVVKKLQFQMLSVYLDIWKKKKSGMTHEQIAEKVYPGDSKQNIESALRKVKRGHRIAKGLIAGGYKNLGVNL